MNKTHLLRAALSAALLSCALAPAHAQYYGNGNYGTPFVPTYSYTVFIDLAAATSDALTPGYGALSTPLGTVYSGSYIPGTDQIRPTQMQWNQVSHSGPLNAISAPDASGEGAGFTMTAATGDSISFSNLVFSLTGGTVWGTIIINGEEMLNTRIWNSSNGPIPDYPQPGAPLTFTADAAAFVSGFVNRLAPGAVHDQFQKSLIDGPIGTLLSDQFVTSVPEPSTWSLMGLGLFGLLVLRRANKTA